ncbi:hypothetical protein LWI29_022714 [Acer saccharum]|uniref:Uncharacterized protein n=1 Tax=Acer saccharum TaxID=4024 RepID=A0AA39S6C8_ACESA|nr:hypothetical protein LWI29_022714 [Acer saccharum]
MKIAETESRNGESQKQWSPSRENVRLQLCLEREEERKKITERWRNGTRRSTPTLMVVRVYLMGSIGISGR